MTVIKSKVERSYWKNVALSVIPDLLIAWAAMRLMDGDAAAFFGTLIALQAVYLALWIKRSAWSWLLFWLSNRSFMSGHIEEVLARDNFPRPPDFISGPDDYYSGIVENKGEACEMRIKAAHELGTLAGISVAGQHQLAIQLRMAMEDALQRYAKQAAVPKDEKQTPDDVALSLPKEELDTLAWLADYGFRLLTAPSDTYRRTMDQLPYRQAAAYASLIDKFERKSVPDLLLEDENEKERRFTSHENRSHTLWSCYPNER
ncbi:hypothetical protein ACVI1J_002298 [Bradyrhizobium diazoefficiens]